MATSNRAGIYNKIYRVLKRHYKPVPPLGDRSVLEHLLYACCLENAHYDKADQVFLRLVESFFDWNEVRVTTVTELSEVMAALPDPATVAANLKKALQSVFESCYSFDLESLRKQNIGPTVRQLEEYGATPFSIAYVTQHALAGHSIPKDSGVLQVLYIVGAITEDEAGKGQAPGMERTIPKKKGTEFASLLHQLGADLIKGPFAPAVRSILLEIDQGAKQRFPKRQIKKKASKAARSGKTKKTSAKGNTTAKRVAKKKTPKNKKAATKKTRSTAARKKSSARRISQRKPR